MEPFQKARSLYTAGRMHDALEAAQVAAERQPKDAEAWWLLGCISRYTGLPAASDDAFKRAAQLSKQRPLPHRVDPEVFRRMVDEALGRLSPDARRRLDQARVRVEPLPALEAIVKGASPDSLLDRRHSANLGRVAANKGAGELVLFQVNFENRSGSEAELRQLVARTVSRA